MNYDVIVVGAGLSGLIAAAKARESGKKVLLISKGHGDVSLTSGCLDILGYLPEGENVCLSKVNGNLELLVEQCPTHPYSKVGIATIKESIDYFIQLTKRMGYPYKGDGISNYLLPTSLGMIRPTGLVPETMVEGDVRAEGNVLVVGFEELIDFYPKLIADQMNLIRSRLNLTGEWMSKRLSLGIISKKQINTLQAAKYLEDKDNLNCFIRTIKNILPPDTKVALPDILGRKYSLDIFQKVSEELNCPVFEIPTGQPTLSGFRLYNLLLDYVKGSGVRVQMGSPVISVEKENQIIKVIIDSPGRPTTINCQELVIATGGLYGKGLVSSNLETRESLMDLSVVNRDIVKDRVKDEGFSKYENYQPIKVGIAVDHNLTPIQFNGERKLSNIRIVGRSLEGYDPIKEKSGLGVALATGYAAGKALVGGDSNETYC